MKLTRYYNTIESMADKLNEAIESIEEKMCSIEDKAFEHDRDLTEKEQTKYDELEEEIDAINSAICDLESAMDTLSEYCNW